ncbi:MAG: DUF3137 domain-containing protein, partial [Micrococcales bacterium]|nr:DUF3137 domain-containing protein [Micrococcales bacterium]
AVAWLLLSSAFICGLIVLFVLVTRNWQQRERQRQAQLAAWAAANGFTYAPQFPPLTVRWKGPPFVNVRNAEARDVITGRTPRGRDFCSFLYMYVVQSGKSSQTFYFWVMALTMPAALPWLMVNRNTFGDKLSEFFGGQDIELESDDFNRAYRVRAASQELAYGVLQPRTIEWLLGPGQAITPLRTDNADLIHWRSGQPDPAELVPHLELMDAFVDAIPQLVWEDFAPPAGR